MNGELFAVDSNILIYAYNAAEGEKYRTANKLITSCFRKEVKLAISTQSLGEFFSVTTKRKILSKEEAFADIADFIQFSHWIKLDFTHLTVLEGAMISKAYDMPWWDSLLAATLKKNGVLHLYTENTKDFKIPWLHTVNPFALKH